MYSYIHWDFLEQKYTLGKSSKKVWQMGVGTEFGVRLTKKFSFGYLGKPSLKKKLCGPKMGIFVRVMAV